MTTMKAAVVPELGAKLEVSELDVPTPGPGQVLVKMEASGLCHTDIHAAYGDWPVKPNPPFPPGHEGVGIVSVPDEVSSFDAAPLSCAGVTTFKAIKVAGLQPGETASIGSIVGTRKDLADVFALHAAGRTRVIAEPRQLQDVNACFDEVLSGHIPARLVFTF